MLNTKSFIAPPIYALFTLWGLLLDSPIAFALNEEDATDLAAVVVDARRSITVSQQLSLPSSYDRTWLEDSGKADLTVGFRGLSGISINQSNASSSTGLILRGASGGLGLVTLDGVPLFSNFTGFFPLSHYPLDMLEQVNVTRGSGDGGSLSRTLGGAINLSSRRMRDGKTFLHSEGGSYGTLRTHLGGGTHNNGGDWTLAAGRTDIFEGVSQAEPTQGKGERDGFEMSNGLLHWNRDFASGNLDSSLYFVRSQEAYDGPGLLPQRNIGWKDDPNGLMLEETWVAQIHGDSQLTDHWQSSFRIGATQDRASGDIGNLFGKRFPVDLTSQLWLGHWENAHSLALNATHHDRVRLIWGVDAQQQHADSPFNPFHVYALTNTVVSPLTRIELEWGNWLYSTEIRFDHNDEFGDHTVFNSGGGWRLSPDMLVWIKGGTGYRAPAVNERLHPLFGNPTVTPERSAGGEIGWSWQVASGTELGITSSFQRYDNLIVLQQDPKTGIIATQNYPRADVWSAELRLQHSWNEAWRSGLDYTFMDARNPQSELQLAVRPEHQGRFWQEWHILQPLRIRLELNFRDGYWTDPMNTLRIKPSPRLNVQLNYQVVPQLRTYVRGENLNDDHTPDLQGFNTVGASLYTGFSLDW